MKKMTWLLYIAIIAVTGSLIGTILPRDKNTPPRAILQTTAGNKTYILTIGENLDTHTEVVDIQPKQVTLATDGKQRTLKLPIRF